MANVIRVLFDVVLLFGGVLVIVACFEMYQLYQRYGYNVDAYEWTLNGFVFLKGHYYLDIVPMPIGLCLLYGVFFLYVLFCAVRRHYVWFLTFVLLLVANHFFLSNVMSETRSAMRIATYTIVPWDWILMFLTYSVFTVVVGWRLLQQLIVRRQVDRITRDA